MNGMCFDPNHRPPARPPTAVFLNEAQRRLCEIEEAWIAFRDSELRPKDWIATERVIRETVTYLKHECMMHERIAGGAA
ncbi:MAG: hypothetical protein HC841_00130 [Verrucomicrobiae bacterium]|nr:hypothetical protein [Verrucomicrobiae bacterium]